MKLFFCIILVLCVCGCGLTGGETSPPQTGLYIVNVSPDAPAISVQLNTTTIASNLTYGQDSGYIFSYPGSYDFSISENGTTLLNQLLSLQAGKYFSLFIVDSFSRLKAMFIEDKYSSDTFSTAKVRLLNFVTNSPSLVASFTNNTPDTLRYTADTVIFSRRIFNDQSTSATISNFKDFIPATYKLSLYQADTTTPIKAFENINLQAGKYYTIYLKGLTSNSALPLDTAIIRR